MNKKILLFGILPVLAICLVAAGLLTYYGQIQQEVTVDQAVILDCPNNDCTESPVSVFSGDSLVSEIYILTNLASTSRDVLLETSYGQEIDDGEIITEYSLMGVLELTGKSDCYAEGQCLLENEPKAIVHYTIVGNEFIYSVESEHITVEDYTLVYYPDYNYQYTADVIPVDNIGSFPVQEDSNGDASTSTYCANNLNPDDVNCVGGKLWLIPTDMINFDTNKIIGWNGDAYLFETDLITYDKENWKVNGDSLTLEAGESLSFVVVNEFMTTGFDGTITTSVEPIV